jgi:hypothetical protein
MEHQDQARAILCRYEVAALAALGVSVGVHLYVRTSSTHFEALLRKAQHVLMQACVHCSRQGRECA